MNNTLIIFDLLIDSIKWVLILFVDFLQTELSEKNIINLKNVNNGDQIKNLMLPQLTVVIRSIIDDDRSKVSVQEETTANRSKDTIIHALLYRETLSRVISASIEYYYGS